MLGKTEVFDNEDTKPATVLEDAERLLSHRTPNMAFKTDPEIKRLAVAELLDGVDVGSKSDAYVEGAFEALRTGDARIAQTRRMVRLQAEARQQAQVRFLSEATPAGNA
jgi:hypothetical protein